MKWWQIILAGLACVSPLLVLFALEYGAQVYWDLRCQEGRRKVARAVCGFVGRVVVLGALAWLAWEVIGELLNHPGAFPE